MNLLNWLLNFVTIIAVLSVYLNPTSFNLNNTLTSDQSNAVPYIFGGQEAKAFQYPYMVFLRDNRQQCGGSIIGHNVVITAAHCIGSQNPSDYQVFGHRHNLNFPPNSEKAVKFPVKQIIVHPNYNDETFENDIALLILRNNNPRAIPGANMDNLLKLDTQGLKDGSEVKVIGWGITREGKASSVLRETDLKVVSDRNCQNLFICFNPDLMICVGSLNDGDSACQGDSGGPLVAGNMLIGLVSSGSPNCDLPFSVYTKVSKYVDWINQSR